MRSTIDKINDAQNALERIRKERERLEGNRNSCNRHTIKITHYSDTPLMCDLSGLDAYDELHQALFEVLDKKEVVFKEELNRLARTLVEEVE